MYYTIILTQRPSLAMGAGCKLVQYVIELNILVSK